MNIQARYETLAGEGLKSAAERTLQALGRNAIGQQILECYSGAALGYAGENMLRTHISGVRLDNPVMVGAGWDKRGRAVQGLAALGFAGVEVGTVLPFGQKGNDKPRLWTINKTHSVGLNRLGFNSPGSEVVEDYLESIKHPGCIVGLNVGRNKVMPNNMAAWAHQTVIEQLESYADYVVLGISSPNTAGLRGLQDKGPLRELIVSAKEVIPPTKPLFIKIDSERSRHELSDMIEVGLETGLDGIVATNTYMGSDLKAKYGHRWANEAGGLSGADADFRRKSTATVRHIYEEAGDKLAIIGVGGVDSPETALEKITAGASAIQLVTAIRPSKGKVAAEINRGLMQQIERDDVTSIRDYIGANTVRGVR